MKIFFAFSCICKIRYPFLYDKMFYISVDINGKKPLSECRADIGHYTRNLLIEAFINDH